MFQKITTGLLAIGLMIALGTSVDAAEPPIPRSFLGVGLNAQDNRVAVDTLGWNRVASAFGLDTGLVVSNPRTACLLFSRRGYRLMEGTDAPAASIGLLLRRGYRMISLSRWYYVSIPQMPLAVFGTRREPEACPAVSPAVWELLDNAEFDPPSYMHPDHGVRISFAGVGTTVYEGRKNLIGSFQPIEGIQDILWINRDHFMKRTLLALYVVADGSIGARELARASERMMDSMQLDATYKPPRLTLVKCQAGDTANLVRRVIAVPDSQKTAEPVLKRVDTKLSQDGMSLDEVPVDSIAVGANQPDSLHAVDSVSIPASVATLPDSAKPEVETIGEPVDSAHTADSVAAAVATTPAATDTVAKAAVTNSEKANNQGTEENAESSEDQESDANSRGLNGVFIGIGCALINIIPIIAYFILVSRPAMTR